MTLKHRLKKLWVLLVETVRTFCKILLSWALFTQICCSAYQIMIQVRATSGESSYVKHGSKIWVPTEDDFLPHVEVDPSIDRPGEVEIKVGFLNTLELQTVTIVFGKKFHFDIHDFS